MKRQRNHCPCATSLEGGGRFGQYRGAELGSNFTFVEAL
jgi:hypothetical protein